MERPTKEQVDAAMRREPSWRVAIDVLADEVRAMREDYKRCCADLTAIDAHHEAEKAELRQRLVEAQNGYNDHAKLCNELRDQLHQQQQTHARQLREMAQEHLAALKAMNRDPFGGMGL